MTFTLMDITYHLHEYKAKLCWKYSFQPNAGQLHEEGPQNAEGYFSSDSIILCPFLLGLLWLYQCNLSNISLNKAWINYFGTSSGTFPTMYVNIGGAVAIRRIILTYVSTSISVLRGTSCLVKKILIYKQNMINYQNLQSKKSSFITGLWITLCTIHTPNLDIHYPELQGWWWTSSTITYIIDIGIIIEVYFVIGQRYPTHLVLRKQGVHSVCLRMRA